ncbi:MAG TPA: 4Fe-4S dicluster domain-containing protein [Candidatus Methylomirabilis sp.]|jgi:Fe-S-cluster-containing hydrogenase component 2|nr:4Fe-4S dicluster domain-containing protein [Candidatus Methylomirabilis sp.]
MSTAAEAARGIFVRVEVSEERCVGIAACGKCLPACPVSIFIPRGDRIGVQEEDECILCDLCLQACQPYDAIRIVRLYEETPSDRG